jgi:1,4-dihydroxy-2-naphthoate octaprenyltransferase
MTLKPWIAAARLRTLPLAFSSIILGTCLAAARGHFNVPVFILCLLTTLFYQVLSNYANDYGDGIKGTDDQRVGEQRAIAAGTISLGAMRRAITLFAVLSFASGTGLSILATRDMDVWVTLTFILLGLLAILAAITYTVGNRAYGYYGLGDLAVLIFFGIVGVGGSFFLQAGSLDWEVLLPAVATGLLAVGVLNLNNMRDIDTDRVNGKNTLVVHFGLRGAKVYHLVLLVLAFDLAFIYNLMVEGSFWQNLYWLVLPLLLLNLNAALRAQTPSDFEPLLKVLAITTLLFSLLFGIGQIL